MLSPPYDNLAHFARNLAICLEGGVGVEQSLETASQSLAGTTLAPAMQVSLTRVGKGMSLAEALKAIEWGLPPFFVPMIEAGEQTGRTDEALRYLERHCRLLVAPTNALRNAWLIPLAFILFGTIVQLAVHVLYMPWTTTLRFVFSSLTSYVMLAVIAFIVIGSPAKPFFDQLKMFVPVIRDIERESAINHFFHALTMLYAAGGRRVESMITFSARTVSNDAIRKDLLAAVRHVQQGDTITEVFRKSRYLLHEEQALIESGEMSGTLEKSFERIATDAAGKLQFRLEILQRICTSSIAGSVVFYVVVTVMLLILSG